jgi:hypothetical protein
MKFKLPRFHLPHCFGLQDGDSVDAAILQKREHKARHIGGGR